MSSFIHNSNNSDKSFFMFIDINSKAFKRYPYNLHYSNPPPPPPPPPLLHRLRDRYHSHHRRLDFEYVPAAELGWKEDSYSYETRAIHCLRSHAYSRNPFCRRTNHRASASTKEVGFLLVVVVPPC